MLLAFGAGACGLIAGLPDYASGTADGSGITIQPHPDATGTQDDSTETGPGDDTTVDPGGDVGADAGSGSDDVAPDTGTSEGPTDASEDAQDAAAICRTQCSGCCDSNNICHGGQSLATCGSGGKACMDCSASGKVCSSAGACVTGTTMEAGPPPMCSVGNCKNGCPLLEAPCCKADQTCGCAVLGLLLCN